MPQRILIGLLLCLGCFGNRAEAYDRQAAVRYADQWSLNDVILRNPVFNTYNPDCTNFVSQTQIAGNRRFDFANGLVDSAGAMPRVAELLAELESRGGNVQSLDYTDPTMIPISLPRGNPAFLYTNKAGGIFINEGHSIINVGAFSDVDVFNPAGNNLLRYDGHTRERYHAPFSTIPWVNNGWVAQSDVHILTLQDAPIIKYLTISQMVNGQRKTLDTWQYDDDYDPFAPRLDYYFNTYNGLHPVSMDNPHFATAGDVTVTIIFDTPMRQNNLTVTMGTNIPDDNQVAFRTVGWSNTHQVSDTWTGTALIPQGTFAANGLNFIKINAFGADSSQINQNSYLNGYVPAPDVTHVMRVDTLPPAVTPKDQQGSIIQPNGFTNSKQISIFVDDSAGVGVGAVVSGPGRLEIFSGDPNAGGTLLASNNDPFATSHVYTSADTGLSILGNMPEGKSFVRATDQAGNQSSVFAVFVDYTAPRIKIIDDDFRDVPDQGVTDTAQINIGANDLAADGATPGSGVAAIALKQDKDVSGQPGTFSESKDFPAFPTSESVNFPQAGGKLAEGSYTATITDHAGNKSTKQFRILRRYLEVLDDSQAPIADGGARRTLGLNFVGPATAANFTLVRLDNPSFVDTFPAQPRSVRSVQASATQVAEGVYIASDYDAFKVLVASQAVTVDRLPPRMVVSDPQGHAIPDKGASQAASVSINVADDVSGVAALAVTGFPVSRFNPGNAGVTKTASFGPLGEGKYAAVASDFAGNGTTVTFTIDRTAPKLTIGDSSFPLRTLGPFQGEVTSPSRLWLHNKIGETQLSGIRFDATDMGSGFGSMTIFRSEFGVVKPMFTQTAPPGSGQAITSGQLSALILPDAVGYRVETRDAAGNLTSVNFDIDSKYPSVGWRLSVDGNLRLGASVQSTDETSGLPLPAQFVSTLDLPTFGNPFATGVLSANFRADSPSIPQPDGVADAVFSSVLMQGDASGLMDGYGQVALKHSATGGVAAFPAFLTPGSVNPPYKLGSEKDAKAGIASYFGAKLLSATLDATCLSQECFAFGAVNPMNPGCAESDNKVTCGNLSFRVGYDVNVSCPAGSVSFDRGKLAPTLDSSWSPLFTLAPITGPNCEFLTACVPSTLLGKAVGSTLGPQVYFQGSYVDLKTVVPVDKDHVLVFSPYGGVKYSLEIADGAAVAPSPRTYAKIPSGTLIKATFGQVSLTLASVTGDNNTATAMPVQMSAAPGLTPAPGANPPGYDITATNYTGPVTVTVPFDPTALTPAQQSQLGLFHLENKQWVNITTDINTTNGTITGTAPHLSLFGIFLNTGGVGNGQALNIDTNGRIWEVAQDMGRFKLAQYDAQANPLTSTVLPDASAAGNWTIRFDAQNNAYAVGVASGAATIGGQLSVYKVSPQGLLVSSAAFSAGFDAQAQALDSTGDIWITGDTLKGSMSAGGALMGLWHYSFLNNTLTQVASYSRHGGMDAGMGIRLDPAGNIWIAGFSMNPSPAPGAPPIDLALWEYGQNGSLLAGPFTLPGYLQSSGGDINAKLEISSDTLFIAATRKVSAGIAMDVSRWDLGGNLINEQSWSGAGSAVPQEMALDAQGNVVVAGGLFGSQSPQLALWRYDPNGNFLDAQTVPGARDARGAAVNAADTWLAVAGSSVPFHFAAGQTLPGIETPVAAGPTGGLAVAADGSGNVWELVQDNGQFKKEGRFQTREIGDINTAAWPDCVVSKSWWRRPRIAKNLASGLGFPEPDGQKALAYGPTFAVRAAEPEEARRICKMAETRYAYLLGELGLHETERSGRYLITVYSGHEEYMRKTKVERASDGLTRGNAIYLYEHNYFEKTLAHEITHLILTERLGRMAYRHDAYWLSEGLAVVMSERIGEPGREAEKRRLVLLVRAVDKKLPSVADMMVYEPRELESERTILWYRQAAGIVEYMLKKGGRERLAGFIGCLKFLPAALAFQAMYGDMWGDLAGLERDWRAELASGEFLVGAVK